MAAADRAITSRQNCTRCDVNGSPRKLPSSMKRVKIILSVLLIFTTVCVFVFIAIRQGEINRVIKDLVPPQSLWNLPPSAVSSSSPTSAGNLSADLQKGKDTDIYNSDLLKTFVKTKNFSSVTEYLLAVESDLLTFRSPVIREHPSRYSWPETDTERKERKMANKTKLIVWYNAPPHVHDQVRKDRFDHCPVKDCVMSFDYKKDHAQADAVAFLSGPGKVVPPRDHAKQVYIFYTMESPWGTDSGYKYTPWNTAFNWTYNFRTDSDIYESVDYLKRSASVPSHSSLLALRRQKKKSVAWMASNCQVQSRRNQYVQRLQKVIPVDVYGRCGNLSCPRWARQCDLLLNDYLFYLAFENSMCVDYVTEKLYKTFSQGVHVIPVVRGGANYSRFFPAGTFIDAEAFPSPEELGRYLLELAHDEARYVDMLWRMAHFVCHEDGHREAFCQLCYKLHHLDRFKKTYSDMYGWYHRHGCSQPKLFRKKLRKRL